MTSGIDILVVGDGDIESLVPERFSCASVDRVDYVPTSEHAAVRLREETYDLAALICHRRGSFKSKDIAKIQIAAPLCRIVAIAGPWCEGLWRRTSDGLPGVTIVPWHRWGDWLRSSANQLRAGAPAAWSLPATTAHDELADFWSRVRVNKTQGLIAINSDSRDAAEAIGDVLSLAGFAYVWQQPDADSLIEGASVIVVDCNGWNEEMARRVASLRSGHPQSQVVSLVNFPLPRDVIAAKAAGSTSVVAKPFTLSEFLGQLDQLAATSAQPKPSEAA